MRELQWMSLSILFYFLWTRDCGCVYAATAPVTTTRNAQINWPHWLTTPVKTTPYWRTTSPYWWTTKPYTRGTTPYWHTTTPYWWNTTRYTRRTTPYWRTTRSPYRGTTTPYRLTARPYWYTSPSVRPTTQPYWWTSQRHIRSTVTTQAAFANCSEDLYGSSGEFTSPNYPGPYMNNFFCTWNITVPEYARISLRFTAFDVENNVDCRYDAVYVYDVNNMGRRTLRTVLCGNSIPQVIISNGNQMSVTFKTDYSETRGGFRAVYSTEYNQGTTNTTSYWRSTRPYWWTTPTSQPRTTQPYWWTTPTRQPWTNQPNWANTSPSSSPAIGNHQISIRPTLFQPDTRSLLSVNCSLDSLAPDIDSVVSIVLARQSSRTHHKEVLATLTAFHPDSPTLKPEATDAKAEGVLDNEKGSSYLMVSWNFPTLTEAAVYTCEANVLNEMGHPVSSNVYASSAVDQAVSNTMSHEELIHNLRLLQQENLRAMEAYQNLSMAFSALYTYAFNSSFETNNSFYILSKFQSPGVDMADKLCSTAFFGKLVEIDTYEEYSKLQQFLALNLGTNEMVLTGATDEIQEGEWINRHSQTHLPVFDWIAGKPSGDVNKNCLALLKTQYGVHMTDTSCSLASSTHSTHFLCEIKKTFFLSRNI